MDRKFGRCVDERSAPKQRVNDGLAEHVEDGEQPLPWAAGALSHFIRDVVPPGFARLRKYAATSSSVDPKFAYSVVFAAPD